MKTKTPSSGKATRGAPKTDVSLFTPSPSPLTDLPPEDPVVHEGTQLGILAAAFREKGVTLGRGKISDGLEDGFRLGQPIVVQGRLLVASSARSVDLSCAQRKARANRRSRSTAGVDGWAQRLPLGKKILPS